MSEGKREPWHQTKETPPVSPFVAVWEGFKAKTTAHAVPHLHNAQGKTVDGQLLKSVKQKLSWNVLKYVTYHNLKYPICI